MNLDELYEAVSAAIGRVKDLDGEGDPASEQAYRELSRLEEEIAELVPASEAEGAIARRGAVRAAVAAKDFDRAENLTARFGRDMIPDQHEKLLRLVPRVLTPTDVTEPLRQILLESRRKCTRPDPCPALNEAVAGMEQILSDFDVDDEWLVLARTQDDVPGWWIANGLVRVGTFEGYVKRLTHLVQGGKDVCESRCVALPTARERLKTALDAVRRNRDLVVIRR